MNKICVPIFFFFLKRRRRGKEEEELMDLCKEAKSPFISDTRSAPLDHLFDNLNPRGGILHPYFWQNDLSIDLPSDEDILRSI